MYLSLKTNSKDSIHKSPRYSCPLARERLFSACVGGCIIFEKFHRRVPLWRRESFERGGIDYYRGIFFFFEGSPPQKHTHNFSVLFGGKEKVFGGKKYFSGFVLKFFRVRGTHSLRVDTFFFFAGREILFMTRVLHKKHSRHEENTVVWHWRRDAYYCCPSISQKVIWLSSENNEARLKIFNNKKGRLSAREKFPRFRRKKKFQ